MITFNMIVLVLALIATVFLIVLLIQNERVFNYRKKVISIAYDLSMKDISEGKFSSRWWEILNYVSYNDMLLHFWKPLDSFFPPELRPKK